MINFIKSLLLLIGLFQLSFRGFSNDSLILDTKPNSYQIASVDIDGKPDTIWVMFPNIEKSLKNKQYITFSSNLINPKEIQIGDSIALDSAYQISLKVVKIEWIDTIRVNFHCTLPNYQNEEFLLHCWYFAGGYWVIEGQSGYSPVACDHLQFFPAEKNLVGVKLSHSRNCTGTRIKEDE